MSKIIKCACGGVYTDIERHKKQRKHKDYQNEYVNCMVLLATEQFVSGDRIDKSKKYLNERIQDHPDPIFKLKEIKSIMKKRQYMTTERTGEESGEAAAAAMWAV